MATKGSAAGFAAKRPDHLQAEGRRWPPKGQQQVLQQKDQITYRLRGGDGHQWVSSRFFSKEIRSLTSWEQEMVTNGSVAGFVAKRPDHLQAEGRRWQAMSQQVLQQIDQITYILRQATKRSAARFCSKETRSLTF
jgi:hypothetical protein